MIGSFSLTPPYQWQPVTGVTLNGPGAGHRVTWASLMLACGHEKEHERRSTYPARVRCYDCGRER